MTALTRRRAIQLGAATAVAGLAGCLGLPDDPGASEDEDATGDGSLGDPAESVEVVVTDMPNPSFEPPAVHVAVGGTVTWTVEGQYHTVTSYHPDTYGPRRWPEDAEPFRSGILRRHGEFEWTFDREGVYDYVDTRSLCAPHEALGAVGRVVVGWPDLDDEPAMTHDEAELQGRATTVMRELNEETRAALESP